MLITTSDTMLLLTEFLIPSGMKVLIRDKYRTKFFNDSSLKVA